MKIKKNFICLFIFSFIFSQVCFADLEIGLGGVPKKTLQSYYDTITGQNNSYKIELMAHFSDNSNESKGYVTLTADSGTNILIIQDSDSNNRYERTIIFKGEYITATAVNCNPSVSTSNGNTSLGSNPRLKNGDKVSFYYDTGKTYFIYTVKQDSTAPTITINTSKYANLDNKNLSFSAYDENRLNSSTYKIECAELSFSKYSYESIFVTTKPDGSRISDGTYKIKYSVSDYVGNIGVKEQELIFDTTAPEVSYQKNPDSFSQQAKIQAIIKDAYPNTNNTYYSYKLNNVPDHDTGNVAILDKEGKYTDFCFTATDKAGNIGSSTKISFTVDKTPPVITVDPYTKDWTKSAVTVSATATDNYALDTSKWKYSIDNGDKVEMSPGLDFNKVFDLDTGIHNIYIYVSDKARNEATSEKITLLIDKTKPTKPTITNSCNNTWTNKSVTVSAKSEDKESGISYYLYSLNNQTWIQGSSVTIDEAYCNKTIYFKAVDKAGNISDVSSSKIMIDTKKPNKPILTNSSDGDWTKEDIVVTAYATDNESDISYYLYSFDKKSWVKGNSVTIENECNKTIYFKALDYAGNESDIEQSNIKIDRTNPVITIQTPIPSKSKSLTISATSSDANSGIRATGYEISINSQKFSDEVPKTTISANLEN